MSDGSAIQWTDATWNPTTGCTKISPGCANCYIERTPAFRIKGRKFVDGHIPLELHVDRLLKPLTWREPRRIFVNSLSDLFHEDVPDQFIVDVFGIMALAHWHTFQVLTKRPERMQSFLAAGDHGIVRQFMLIQQNGGIATRQVFRALDIKRRDNIEWRWPLLNVWLGVSVENQHFADERIPLLLETPAAVRFISAEPLLGPIDVGDYLNPLCECETRESVHSGDEHDESCPAGGGQLDWGIVGLESDGRAGDLEWVRGVVAQFKAAGVPLFVKQLGSHPYTSVVHREDLDRMFAEKDAAYYMRLRDKKGGDPAEWPADLRIREYPESKHALL